MRISRLKHYCHCFCSENEFCNICQNIEYHHIIKHALKRFIKEDFHLSKLDANERSQTHKIAEYLQDIIPELHVDCEYNKNINKPKELDFNNIVNSIKRFLKKNNGNENLIDEDLSSVLDGLQKELENSNNISIADEGDIEGDDRDERSFTYLQFTTPKNKKYIKRVYPDIIAHLRGTKNNKIVIEAKKESNNDPKAEFFDLVKLSLFTDMYGQFGYDAGYFIKLPSKQLKNCFRIKITPYTKIKINSNVFIVEFEECKEDCYE